MLFLVYLPFFLNVSKGAYGQSTLNEKLRQNQVLNCPEVRSRLHQILDLHYAFKDFSEELSQRTFRKLFENFDSGKIIFTSLDVARFQNIRSKLPELVESKNCEFIFDIYDLLTKRIQERVVEAQKMISQPMKLSPLLYVQTNKQQWVRNEQELNDRLKKKIFFQYLKMKELNLDEEVIKKRIMNTYLKMEKKILNYSTDKIYSIFLNSFAQSLDPHSSHMLPADQVSFSIHISNHLEGIGAQLKEEDGFIVVKSIIPGGVAEKDGRLKVNDRILAVDDGSGSGSKTLGDLDIEKVIELVRGKKGSALTLFVSRMNHKQEEKYQIKLVRDEINLKEDNVKSWMTNTKGVHIGIIKIPSFYTDLKCKSKLFVRCRGVAFDTAEELKKLQEHGLDGVVIDLRNNGGGDFPESIKVTSLFIPSKSIVVQTTDRNNYTKKQESENMDVHYTGPLIVLINRYSASASEIFSGAIQDYARGIIVGDDHTYGKATVQVVQEIPGTDGRKSDGAMKVTQNKFYRPGGTSNQRVGVHSDIIVESINQAYPIGEVYLDYTLSRDSIAPAKGFRTIQNLEPLLVKLRKLSQKRLAQSTWHQELLSKIEEIKRDRNKSIPLQIQNLREIEERKNGELQIKNTADKKDVNKNILASSFENDYQLTEALQIARDAVNLSKSTSNWAHDKDRFF